MPSSRVTIATVLLWASATVTCAPSSRATHVVVYTSVDQVHAEPVLKRFSEATGVDVRPVFDVEAAKTTGLAGRLVAERAAPSADVFWSGEFVQTILLKQQGVLAAFRPSRPSPLTSQYSDPDSFWHGFAGRARVLLVNTRRVSAADFPSSVFDLLDERFPADRVGIARPLFGTSATHAAALTAALGAKQADGFFTRLQTRGVRVLDGNSIVRDWVVTGQLSVGLTDTDDACAAVARGAPVSVVLPDQQGLGTLVIPTTVALVAGGPNPAGGRQLVDYLLGAEVERHLIESGWSHVSLAAGAPVGAGCLATRAIRAMAVTPADVFGSLGASSARMRELFLQ